MPDTPSTGTGNVNAHTWISNGVLAAFLAALLAAATTFLHSYQPTPGTTAAAVASDPLMKTQLDAMGKAIQDLAKPAVVAPAVPVVVAPVAHEPTAAETMKKLMDRLDELEKRLPAPKK